jgi:hypothetical protein
MSSQYDVCLVSLHPGGGAQLAEYQKVLEANKIRTKCLAAEKGLLAIEQRKVEVVNFAKDVKGEIEKLAPEQITKLFEAIVQAASSSCRLFITDVGHPFMVELHKFLEEKKIKHALNYDNSENLVPGWSEIVGKTAKHCPTGIFANSNFAKPDAKIFAQKGVEIDFARKEGIGYFPLQEAEAIKSIRTSDERLKIRKEVTDKEKPFIATYVGGANADYWEKAFPTFIECLSVSQKTHDLSWLTILFQKHPRTNNSDVELLEKFAKEKTEKSPQVVFSTLPTTQAVAASDLVIYHQTGMAATFALAGCKTVQVAKEPFVDVLVGNGLCPSVNTAEAFMLELEKAAKSSSETVDLSKVYAGIGIQDDWQKRLVTFVRKAIGAPSEEPTEGKESVEGKSEKAAAAV